MIGEKKEVDLNKQVYSILVTPIRGGTLRYASVVRDFVEENGLPMDKLKEAIKHGCEYKSKCDVEYGYTSISSGIEMKRLLEEYNIPTEELDKALEKGGRKAYERNIRLIESGSCWVKECEPEARELAKIFGYPEEPIDEALEKCNKKGDRK